MKVFVTGATGFIGGRLARALRTRGNEVAALVRDPAKAAGLEAVGCRLVRGDLGDKEALRSGMEVSDAVVHAAAMYEVGIPESRKRAMYEANVTGTDNVFRTALELGLPKVVYVSTVAAFGNTRGEVVDENYEHVGSFGSYYEETKVLAHRLARRMMSSEGLPCVILQPGGVYGPGDKSQLGGLVDRILAGKLPVKVMPDTGFNWVHVDDVVSGILLALDKVQPPDQFVLGGELGTIGSFIDTLARVGGKKPPKRTLPTGLLKAVAPLGPIIGRVMGLPPNLREMIASGEGVTYWARHDKAMQELGYAPRSLERGLRDMVEARSAA